MQTIYQFIDVINQFPTEYDASRVLEEIKIKASENGYITVDDFFSLIEHLIDYDDPLLLLCDSDLILSSYKWDNVDVKKFFIAFDCGNKCWRLFLSAPHKVKKSGRFPMNESDPVNHPSHYMLGDIEVIDVIRESTKELTGAEAVDQGNVIKYILRWMKKNGLQDLLKAQWYLNDLIELVKKGETK